MQLGHHCNQVRHIEELVVANGLQRAELYNYPAEQLGALIPVLRHNDVRVGVHAPLLRKPWYPYVPTWTFLHELDPDSRELSRRLARETVAEAAELGAEYVVIHFPGPLRSGGAPASLADLRAVALESCALLDDWAREAGVPVLLEGFGPNPLFNAGFLTEVFERFPNLGYCWDSGHMHYAAQRDGYDYYRVADALRPYVRSLQIWGNRTVEDYRRYHHIPVHPSQTPAEGWVDIERTLRVLVGGRPDVPVVLESPPAYPAELGGHDYREGITWVRSILDAICT